jgi:hypothetical protein
VFRREVERELTGEDREPWEIGIVYFMLYKSQVPVIDRALETAALMLLGRVSQLLAGEICGEFLAGANLDNGDPETLLFSMTSRTGDDSEANRIILCTACHAGAHRVSLDY